jgi:hypothetical protein
MRTAAAALPVALLALVALAGAAAAAENVHDGVAEPDTVVGDGEAVEQRLGFAVDEVANEGDSVVLSVTLADDVAGEPLDGFSGEVQDADTGESVQVGSSAEVVDGPDADGLQDTVRIGVQPEGERATRNLSVNVTGDVAWPEVDEPRELPVRATVADADGPSVALERFATVTVEPADANQDASEPVDEEDPERDPPPAEEPSPARTFRGDHVRADASREVPGLANVTLAGASTPTIEAVRLPSSDAWQVRATGDELRVEAGDAEVRLQDAEDVPAEIDAGDGGPVRIEAAPAASLAAREDGYAVEHPDHPALVVEDDVQRSGDALLVGDDAEWRLAGADEGEDAREDADRGDRPDEDRRRAATPDEGPTRVGPVAFVLEDERLRNVTVDGTPVFERIDVPGLTEPSAHRQGAHLSIVGEDAEVRLAAADGLLLAVDADDEVRVRVADDARLGPREGHAAVDAGRITLILQGADLAVEDDEVTTAGDLQVTGRAGPQVPKQPTWRPERPPHAGAASALELPHEVEGRFLGFTLTEAGLENVTVHGTPMGSVAFPVDGVDELRRDGVSVRADGPGFEVHGDDAPAAQLRVEADELTADLPDRVTLASEATVTTRVEGDEVRLRVDRPANALANHTVAEHRPPERPVERLEGPGEGLAARSDGGVLGVASDDPQSVRTSFQGNLDGVEGNVSLDLAVERALLVDDANGNGKVDVGDPAVAERPLRNGTTIVDGDELVNRFQLWSGTLDVIVEPGQETAKVTYEARNLSAPPGTLFVLETRVEAPADAALTPTPNGVVVDNGSLEATYAATGPVTVDGSEAWADRSIFVDSDDEVRVLLAYPAGDNITHDPTVSVQGSAAAAVADLAASSQAIAAGAVGAALLVGATAWARQRGPR